MLPVCIYNQIVALIPALIVNGGAALSADIQRWNNNAGATLSVVDNAGNFGIRNSNPSYQLDVTGTGNFSQSIRFGDGTVQSTAYVNSSGELQSLITLNDSRASGLIASTSGSLQPQITTNTAASGSLQSQITSNAAVSGALQPQITTNAAVSGVLQSQISNIESTSVLSGVLQPQITINAAVSGFATTTDHQQCRCQWIAATSDYHKRCCQWISSATDYRKCFGHCNCFWTTWIF